MALPGTVAAADQKVVLLRGADGVPVLRAAAGEEGAALGADAPSAAEERLRLRWEAEARVRERLGPHGMPSKGLQLRDARIRRLMRSGGLSEPDTLRLLLIRIAFEADRSGDLTSVTTDGNFLLEPDSTVVIDPPPHDRDYFQAHMDALAEYWGSMSGGLIVAETKVFPEGREDAYFLSDIADYGPGAGGFWTVELLEKLVRDMIEVADAGTQADGSANLADYDFDDPNTYIIFAHAGADLQSNLVFTEGIEGYSPNDIPTFFVSLGDSAQVDLLGMDTETGEPGRITECSVIPETTSQDGLLGSISAALMHEFGHALGLPDLYSTFTGLPTVGRWAIMDSGTNLAAAIGFSQPDGTVRVEQVVGLLPPSASIWSKWFLGFTDEIRVGSAPRSVSLPASYRQDTREKVVRIDVSPDEFFLLENRYVPPVVEAGWGLLQDPETGVIQYLADGQDRNTHLYDLFLPYAGGLHVWRVRQDRVEEKIFDNTVQALPGELGVELIEADGIQDIGVFEFSTIGFYGSDNDAFRDLSSFVYSDTTVNWSRTSTEFGPDTFPDSESSLQTPTGVRISDIGPASAASIDLTARIEGLLDPGTGPGMPIELPDALDSENQPVVARGEADSPIFATLGGTPTLLVVASAADGGVAPGVYAYDFGGSPRFAQARVAELAGRPAGPPLWLEDGADGVLVSVAVDGTMDVLASEPGGLVGTRSAGVDSVDVGPVGLRDDAGAWVVASGQRADGRLELRSLDGTVLVPRREGGGGPLLSNPVAARDAGGDERLLIVSSQGLEMLAPGVGTIATTLGPGLGVQLAGPGRLVAWPREQGADQLVYVDDSGVMIAIEAGDETWERVEEFGRGLGGTVVGEPVVGDVDGDGLGDLVVATAEAIHAFHASGADLRGYPVRVNDHFYPREPEPDTVSSAPVVADVDGDGRNEVVFVSRLGLLHAMDSDGGEVRGFPRRVSGGDVVAPLVVDVELGAERRRGIVLYEALGDTLDSDRRTRSARLTVADVGPSPDEADRPAEWLSYGGSFDRASRGSLGSEASEAVVAETSTRSATVFPNPLRAGEGGQVFLRFFSGAPHTCRLTVYNLEGQEVLSLRRDVADSGVPVQMQWSALGLQSGPYLCRLDYTGQEGPTSDLMTLFIER